MLICYCSFFISEVVSIHKWIQNILADIFRIKKAVKE